MVTVSFPGIGLDLSVNRVAFSVAGFDIYWYGIFIGIGLALGITFVMLACKKFGIDSDRALDVIIVGAVCGVIGGRLYYVLTSLDEFPTFASVFDLRNGGMAIYGVLIAAFVSAFFMCKWRKVNTLAMFDMAGVGFLFAQALGRWGNFINQEAFGSNTDLPWGMTSSTVKAYLNTHAAELAERGIIVDASLPVHPTFLYESIWCLIGGIFLISYLKRRNFDGEMFLMYCLWYGAGRAFIEGLRTDSLYVGSFRISQVVAVLTAFAAAIAIILIRARQRKDASYRPLYVTTEACRENLAAIEASRAKPAKKKDKVAEETAAAAETENSDDRTKKIVDAMNEPAAEDYAIELAVEEMEADAKKAAKKAEAKADKAASDAKKASKKGKHAMDKATQKAKKAAETAENEIDAAAEKAKTSAEEAQTAIEKTAEDLEKK